MTVQIKDFINHADFCDIDFNKINCLADLSLAALHACDDMLQFEETMEELEEMGILDYYCEFKNGVLLKASDDSIAIFKN